MSWQKRARIGIALFVVVFAVTVGLALRRGKGPAPVAAPLERQSRSSVVETSGPGFFESATEGKPGYSIRWGSMHVGFADGRQKFGGGVSVDVRSNNGRSFTLTSQDVELLAKDEELKTAKSTTNMRLTTEDGLLVTGAEAHYDNADGIVRIPGAFRFTRGRLEGTGVGGTYDLNKDVLWLLDSAHVMMAPDESGGGAIDANAKSAGFARAEHYVRLVGEVRIDAQGRIIRADQVVVLLTEDNQRAQMLQQRGHSRIDGGAGGPQSMAANDIDLTYAADGRTLQSAKLMENASVDLPGAAGSGGRRVAGRNIDIALAPDGSTVTNLTSTERVQVDLPADRGVPARRINSDALVAGGTAEGGLQEATFSGNVIFRETGAAAPNAAAVNRTARSLRLVVRTKPGFGAIEEADFRGHFRFDDGAQLTAEAPRAVYRVETGRIHLSPSDDPGPTPVVSDGKIEVRARTIEFTTEGRRLSAETEVRSTMLPQKGAAGQDATKLPSVLRADETVFATSNRLEYDGAASLAIYNGAARLWQPPDTSIRAGTITVNDKDGSLTAKEDVITEMMMEHEDSRTKERKRVQQKGQADTFEYDDAKRLATYTGHAHVSGPEGDVTAERILLFLLEEKNELHRAEAYDKVTLKEGVRLVQGSRMDYTAADDRYEIKGPPVLIVEEQPNCSEMLANVAVYYRAQNRMLADGADSNTNSRPCTGKRLF